MNIRVNLNANIADGSEVVFRSPADCSQVTGLVIYHNGGKTEFAFADAHGNNVGDIDHLFAENAVVKVILDVTASMAFVQNADTNGYIERTFVKSVNGQAPDENGNVEIKAPVGGANYNPVSKTNDMTQPVGVDKNGLLWVAPVGGSSGGNAENPDAGNTGDTEQPETVTLDIVEGQYREGVGLQPGNQPSLNNYVTPNYSYYQRAKITLLTADIMVKVVTVDENDVYKSTSGWMSREATKWSAGGITEYLIEDANVYVAFAGTELNNNGFYTVSAAETLAKVRVETLPSDATNSGSTAEPEQPKKRCLFIGDSITEHNFRATKNYDDFLAEWLGIESVNRGMSSTGVTHSLTSSPTWLNDLPNYPDDVDCISIMGALNDRHTPLGEWGDRGIDTVYGGVWNYFNNLIEKYPNKPIIYITSTPREYSYGVDGQFTAWVDAFIKTAHNFSIPVLDLYRESNLRPWNASNNKMYFSCNSAPNGDGVHPNELGQELMARKILEFAKVHLFGVGV